MKNQLSNLLFFSMVLVSITGPAVAGENSNEITKSANCAISCSQPMENTCETIIAVLKATTRAVAEKDYVELAKYLDENCTTYDVCTKKTVVGRENIIANVKAKIAAEEKRLKVPAIAFTIDQPFAKITGDKAVVTFVLKKEVGGANPAVFESHVTDVFVKRDGDWKKLHYCGGDWKRVK
ncbi:MAG: nuclear transport factor 2 family protein [Candidatus Melainabacteria bacterium]|nr:MAG: nuclear transport factor 2 family protein [Candidatus Melainabacteria bacterium]